MSRNAAFAMVTIMAAMLGLMAALIAPVAGPAFGQTTAPPPATSVPVTPAPADAAQPVLPAPDAQPSPPGATARPSDSFGERLTLTAKPIIYIGGQANWDTAFETLVAKFKQLNAYFEQQKLTPAGPAMTIYTQTDDTGFSFQAALPVAETPKGPLPEGVAAGTSPAGSVLKFVHRGSYDTLDTTYEAITNHLDEQRLDASDLFIEEYASDPAKTDEDKLVVNIYVPLKQP